MRPERFDRRIWLVIGAAALFMAFVTCGQTYVSERMRHRAEPFLQILIPSLTIWTTWALLAPLVLRVAAAYPIDRRKWRIAFPVHLATATFCAIVVSSALSLLNRALIPSMRQGPALVHIATLTVIQLHTHLMVYAALLAGYSAATYYRRITQQARDTLALEAQLANAQLQALKSQLQPHFLFNTLHAVGALVDENPQAARRMIALIGDLLRLTLEDSARQEVPLHTEMEMLRIYLDIESVRFQDRLACDVTVEPGLNNVAVAPFILQPLVENAIRYGIARHHGAGRVHIAVRSEQDALLLEVWNESNATADAPKSEATQLQPSHGVGLSTTRDRLRRLYGDGASLSLIAENGGVTARIRQPRVLMHA